MQNIRKKAFPLPYSQPVRQGETLSAISSEGVKKSGASSFSAALSRSMEEGAPADRIAAIKQQVQEGTYQVPAEQIARRLMSGL